MAQATRENSGISLSYKFDLACIIIQSRDLAKALEMHQEVLEARESHIGKSIASTLQSYYTVGALHDQLGNLQQAEYHIRIALERSKKAAWSEAAHARAEFHLSKILSRQVKVPVKLQSLHHTRKPS